MARVDTVRFNLQGALSRSLEISPEVKTVEATRSFAEARRRLAHSSRFATEFSATTGHSVAPGIDNPNGTPELEYMIDPDVRNDWTHPRPYNQIELQLLQPIYTFGELSGNIRAARHGVEVEAANVRAKELEVAYRTGEAFYGVLLADALNRLTADAGDIVERAKREIRRLLDEGAEDVDDADLSQVLITEQEYRRRVIEVTQRRQTAYAALTRQLFMPPGSVAAPDTGALQPIPFQLDSLETYFEVAQRNRPEIAQATAGLAARGALVDVARSGYFPKLALGLSTNIRAAEGRPRTPHPFVNDSYRGRGLQLGLGFRQQLNFAQTRARVEQAEAERNEVRYQLDAAHQLVYFEVEDAYRNVIVQRGALEAQNESLRLSREWLLSEQINFDLSLGDTENLVRAVQANLQIQVAQQEAVHRYNLAVLRLLRTTGTLVQSVQNGTLVDK